MWSVPRRELRELREAGRRASGRRSRPRQGRGSLGSVWAAAVLVAASLATSVAYGQPAETRPDPTTTGVPRADVTSDDVPIKERTPRIIYARDAQGNAVPLINVPLERIQELLDQADGTTGRQQPPRYQLDRLEVGGRAENDRAALEVQVTLTTMTEPEQDSMWVSVPLRFHEAALLETPVYEGDGQLLLVYDRTQGYVAWIQQPGRGEHRIKLRLDVGLHRAAQTTQLRFYPPSANVSRLSLSVPGDQVSADLQNGQDLQVQPGDAGNWLLTARDLQSEVVLIWRSGGTLIREQPVQLDARGDISVTIDGPGAIRTDLTLDLQSYGRPVETFVLRLPPHTTLVTGNAQDYDVNDLTDPVAEQGEPRQTVQITLQKPAAQTRLRLTAQTTAEAGQSDQFNVANYEVVGALRQWGQVTLWASEDWLVYWNLGPSVRRVAGSERTEVPEEERQRLATFEYFRQPCRLDVQVEPQGTRIEVEPLYQMHVGEDQVALELRLRYRIQGARESFLEFALNGWQLERVEPASEVENDNFDDAPPRLRLKRPASGDLELKLSLQRRVMQPRGTLRFPLPWPKADAVTTGMLLVTAAPAVQLTPRLQEMPGLVQDLIPEDALTSQPRVEGAAPPAAFRFRSDRALGDVVIDYEVRAQEITVRADTALELSADRADVSQQFTYRVLHQPATQLTLDFPRPLIDLLASPRYRSQIAFEVDGEPLAADVLIDAALAVETQQPVVPITVPLPQPKLGTVGISLRYPWSLRTGAATSDSIVPLAVPRDGRLVANAATLTPVGPLRVQAVDEDWTSETDAARPDALQTVLLSSSRRPTQIRLRVAQPQEDAGGRVLPSGATLVRRAWLQTWLARQQRLDRLVLRIATGADRVFLQLPTGVDLSKVVTLVDGVEVAALPAEHELAIPLSRRPEAEHTLELSLPYRERPSSGRIDIPLPLLRDAAPPQRWFWQLVLPGDEHLLASDPSLTAADRWVRSGWFWRRETPDAQQALERWTESSQQPPLPEGTNQYLFSSFEDLRQLQVRTCPRRVLVYGASAAVLLAGLALIYVSWLRHPLALLLQALAVVAWAWRFPATAAIVAQASVVGLVLWLLALLIWAALRQFQPQSTVPAVPAVRQADSRSGVQPPRRERPGPVSTASVPAPSIPAMLPDSDV